MGLTLKQQKFVNEYLLDLNATQAAIRAGYSEKTAYSIGQENLTKPVIKEAIEKAMEKRAERTEITQERVLREIALLGFSKLQDFVRWGPGGAEIKDLNELTEEQAACVSEVQDLITKDSRNTKFKLYSKEKALEMLCRHLGMFNDKLELSGEITVETGVRRAFDNQPKPKRIKGA
jgi:phage terminase small subunit